MGESVAIRLGLGDRVRLNARIWTVVSLPGGLVHVTNALGQSASLSVHQLAQTQGFEIVQRGPRSCAPVAGPHKTADQADAQARWWEWHLAEVITGLPPDAEPWIQPRPLFDPKVHDLTAREEAKAAELAAGGLAGVSARTVRRKRQRYQTHGLAALTDGRTKRSAAPGARTDPRVLECLLTVLSAHEGRGAQPMEFYRERTQQHLVSVHGADALVWMPSRSTFYRLLKKLSPLHASPSPDGGRAVGEGRPMAIAGGTWLSRPGQRVYLDSVDMRLPGTSRRMRLTVALDELTWSVCALVVDEGGSGADHLSLLARWWTAAEHDTDDAQGREPADGTRLLRDQMPLIMPEQLAIDAGTPGRSRAFVNLCRRHGVAVAPSSPMLVTSGEGKTYRLVKSFAQHLAGRADADQAELWTPAMVQSWARRWTAQEWQHRWVGHLVPIAGSGFDPTPSGAFAACVARQGWLHMPLPLKAYPSLLPPVQRRMTSRGVAVAGRWYDGPALDALRSVSGAARADSSRITVHADPYDTGRIWVQGPDTSWSAVPHVPDSRTAPGGLLHPLSASDPEPSTKPAGLLPAGAPGSSLLPGQTRPALRRLPPGHRGRAPLARASTDRPSVRSLTEREGWRLLVDGGGAPSPDFSTTGTDEARVAYHARLRLSDTPLIRRLCSTGERLLLLNRHAAAGQNSLVLTGPAGSGKSTALLEFGRQHETRERTRQLGSAIAPTLYVSVPPAATANTVLSQMARFLGITAPARTQALSDAVQEALVAADTGVVMIDDAHQMRRRSSASRPDAWAVLQFLAAQVPCLFVYAGVSLDTGKELAQPSWRMTHLQAGAVTEPAVWQEIVDSLDKALRLRRQPSGTLSAAGPYLYRRTGGSVAQLARLVRSAAVQSILDGTERVTEELLAHLSWQAYWPQGPPQPFPHRTRFSAIGSGISSGKRDTTTRRRSPCCRHRHLYAQQIDQSN